MMDINVRLELDAWEQRWILQDTECITRDVNEVQGNIHRSTTRRAYQGRASS